MIQSDNSNENKIIYIVYLKIIKNFIKKKYI